MYLTADMKMAEVITNNPYLLVILENFNIKMPVQDQSVYEVCTKFNIHTDLFLIISNLYNGLKHQPLHPLTHEDAITITKYLKNTHQYYLKEIYPEIIDSIRQLSERNNHKEMLMVDNFFCDYFEEVKEHLDYEDQVVFPYVRDLSDQISHKANKLLNSKYSVREYQDHHNDIQEKLNDLKNLLIKYLPQENDQSLRRKVLFRLSEIEYDIAVHAKIEDLILIPLVESMEFHLGKLK